MREKVYFVHVLSVVEKERLAMERKGMRMERVQIEHGRSDSESESTPGLSVVPLPHYDSP